jgi:hypothetical protein
MGNNRRLNGVLLYEHLGFVGIIFFCYLNDLLKLPSLIFSDHPFSFVFQRSTLEMLLILMVWLLVSASTRRLLERIRHLESFLRVCSWCRRIDYQGEWITLEKFLQQGFDTPTTHGICPDCRSHLKSSIERAKLRRKEENAADAGSPP